MDEGQFRLAMSKFASGITVVSTEYHHEIMAMTVNAFMSVSLSPMLIAISIDEKARMYPILPQTKKFGISILSQQQEHHSKVFAKQLRAEEEIPFSRLDGNPVLQNSIATLSCKITNMVKAGDHFIFIAEVTAFEVNEYEPLIYFNSNYRSLDR
jgi:flavin reductase (DIM6/NTAB) family NADH-FMN oxidoreductase RutF